MKGSLKNIKVGILSVHPAPYRDYIFTELQKEEGIAFEVISYYAEDTGHKEWNWQPPDYPGYRLENTVRFAKKDFVDIRLWNKLHNSKYDLLIIPGYSRFNCIIAILYSVSKKIPFIINLDTAVDATGIKVRSWFKDILVSFILRKAAAFWVPGTASRKYLKLYNIKDNKIFEGSYCLPTDKILSVFSDEISNKKLTRERLNIPLNSFVWLAVGNFIQKRLYKNLVRKFHNTFSSENVFLIIVGDGNEKNESDKFIMQHKIKNILLPGVVTFDKLFSFYAISDAFIHPGKEPYSTATEIAAICGLPVLASYDVGYVHDLKRRNAEPFIFDETNEVDLAEKMKILIENQEMRINLGNNLKAAANTRTIPWAKDELKALVIQAVNKS